MPDIFGIAVAQPPEHWTCLEILVLVKALNQDGREAMFFRQSEQLSSIDALGLLAAGNRVISDDVAKGFEDG